MLLWLILLTQPKKGSFFIFGYLPPAIDSTLSLLQNQSEPWIIHLLSQLIAYSLSPLLHQFIRKPEKWGNFRSSSNSSMRWPLWSLVTSGWHLERSSSKPTLQFVRSQSVSKHQRRKQTQCKKVFSFFLSKLLLEAEEKPKGKEKQKYMVLSGDQPGQEKQREEMLPDSPWKSCEQNFSYLIRQGFFYGWRLEDAFQQFVRNPSLQHL